VTAREDHLDAVGGIVEGLRRLRLRPVLVGGMALVVLGSRRVTRDFDFLVKDPGDRRNDLLDLFYDGGLELASRLNENGDVIATIDNRTVAATCCSTTPLQRTKWPGMPRVRPFAGIASRSRHWRTCSGSNGSRAKHDPSPAMPRTSRFSNVSRRRHEPFGSFLFQVACSSASL
jgi:hypothetical protein